MFTRLAALLLLLVAVPASAIHPLLLVDSGPPKRIIITATPDAPSEPPCDALMALQAAGIIAVLDRGDIAQLDRCLPLNPSPTEPRDGMTRLGVMHLVGSISTRRFDLARAADGTFLMRDLDNPTGPLPRVELKAAAFEKLIADWPAYRGTFDAPPPEANGIAVEFTDDIVTSPITLDQPTLKRRVYSGMGVQIEPARRVLKDCLFTARPPKGYTPRRPAGLLVYIDPVGEGVPPREFDEALDELNIVAIGPAAIGNDRPTNDRLQLALDAVATARARFHIDDRRIYACGMSGGGRVTSMLWGAFPDIFTGGIPVVGLSVYRNASAGPGKIWPAAFTRPTGTLGTALLRHRLGVVTGPSDFNHANTTAGMRILNADNMDAKLFSYDDMGHELPTAPRFAEVLRWVDEPARLERQQTLERADAALKAYTTAFGSRPPANIRERKLLEKVLTAGPWTDPAWQALEWLTKNSTTETQRHGEKQ